MGQEPGSNCFTEVTEEIPTVLISPSPLRETHNCGGRESSEGAHSPVSKLLPDRLSKTPVGQYSEQYDRAYRRAQQDHPKPNVRTDTVVHIRGRFFSTTAVARPDRSLFDPRSISNHFTDTSDRIRVDRIIRQCRRGHRRAKIGCVLLWGHGVPFVPGQQPQRALVQYSNSDSIPCFSRASCGASPLRGEQIDKLLAN